MKLLNAFSAVTMAIGILTCSIPLMAQTSPRFVQLSAGNSGVFVPSVSASPDVDSSLGLTTFVVQGGTAEMIIDDAVLLTATEGARLSLSKSSTGLIQLTLLSGGFRVLAGRAQVQIQLPARTVPLSDIEAHFARHHNEWVVAIGPQTPTVSSPPPFQALVPPRPPEQMQIAEPNLGAPPSLALGPEAGLGQAVTIELEEIEIEADCVEICLE